MALQRTSTAEWRGDLEDGDGEFTVGEDVFSGAYTFASRFEEGDGTNPEELLGAAHAACYSMALSNILAGDGHAPESVQTRATVTLDTEVENGPTITTVSLRVLARVPDLDEDQFLTYAEQAKSGCPVSKLFTGAEVVLDAGLER